MRAMTALIRGALCIPLLIPVFLVGCLAMLMMLGGDQRLFDWLQARWHPKA